MSSDRSVTSTSFRTRGADGCVQERQAEIVAGGDGSPTREFLYVEDAAEGILLAAERFNQSEPVNIGSSFEISIKDLLETIARLTGFEGRIVWDTSKPNSQPRRKLDFSRALERFRFEAMLSFEEGLMRTIVWYAETTQGSHRENDHEDTH